MPEGSSGSIDVARAPRPTPRDDTISVVTNPQILAGLTAFDLCCAGGAAWFAASGGYLEPGALMESPPVVWWLALEITAVLVCGAAWVTRAPWLGWAVVASAVTNSLIVIGWVVVIATFRMDRLF
jgi:hypothetical protein